MEPNNVGPIDEANIEEDLYDGLDPQQAIDEEADLLEKIPLPGYPKNERERREAWLKLPRNARIAIRRMHRNLRHLPKNALIQMLRAARAPNEYIEAAKNFRCETCDVNKSPPQTHKAGRPKPYSFNHEVGADVYEVKIFARCSSQRRTAT